MLVPKYGSFLNVGFEERRRLLLINISIIIPIVPNREYSLSVPLIGLLSPYSANVG